MSPGKRYLIPAENHRVEIVVVNSRFITTIDRVNTVAEAKAFLSGIRAEMPDASHHVHAYRVGYGNSVIESVSDDGEPSGTAGPPVLAVLRGSDIGDIIIVVTRYFGGTKLGTGGLVRAYGDAAREGLKTLKTEEKIEKKLLGIETTYSLYEQIKRLIAHHNGVIDDEDFAGQVTLMAIFPVDDIEAFTADLTELSAGRTAPIILGDA
jgi:uncharacterized YigZ family protein